MNGLNNILYHRLKNMRQLIKKVKLYDRPIIVNEKSIKDDLYPEYSSKDFIQ